MKFLRNLSLLGATVALSNCATLKKLQKPLTSDGFNPLDKATSFNRKDIAPTGSSAPSSGLATGHGFKTGDIVEVAIANTALFNRVPQPGDRYAKVLKVGDSLRVVGTEKDFIKVVSPSGATGYVSSVMVISQGALQGGTGIAPIGDIAPPPEIPGLDGGTIAPIAPIPVPSITEPSLVDPDPVPLLPDPIKPSAPSDPTPDPEIPSLPE